MDTMTKVAGDKVLDAVATGDAPVLETLLQMQMDSFERSGLTEREYMLTRIAALVATDAAPASYMMHFKTAMDMGFDRDTVASVLVAIAPLVGSAKITSAVSHMARAKLLGDEIQRRMSEQYR
jgi:alkylhydroperoxidase/carboxymuconolactone decarboxylase family protein YurZ